MTAPLIEVRDLSCAFAAGGPPWRRRTTLAVDRVGFTVEAGQTLGIVGESGSGKSTLLRMMLRLIRPTAGSIAIDGDDVWSLRGRRLLELRRMLQPVFQDPGASFNPRQSVGALLAAPLEVHGQVDAAARRRRIGEVIELVGLSPSLLDRLPHQLSGGQKQRVAIARAVALRPRVLLLDEPTSALDVSVQAQVLNLFQRTKQELGLTCIFVSHNLAVIRYVSDRVIVMRRGRVVEAGPAADVFERPTSPYTRDLLAAVPDVAAALDRRRKQSATLEAPR